MIQYKTGNLLEAEEDVIIHGVNCVGGFGSGVAGQIAIKFPKVRQYYKDKLEEEGWKLGDIQPITMPWTGYTVINCATQYNYLPRDVRNVDYDALEECLNKVKEYCEKNNFSVASPKIGAGLAGGDWVEIEKIFNKVFDKNLITVYTLEQC